MQMAGDGGSSVMMVDGGGGSGDFRGVKRNASDEHLDDFSRFEKRLRALSIRNDEKRLETDSTPAFHKRAPSRPGVLSTSFKRPDTTTHDGMDVDDTRDRVYIADLDAELASSSSDEDEKLIFLPDIEKRFNRLPHQVFGPSPPITGRQDGQEMVLYADPKSLSVDERDDSVRKAVVEARQRAREEAVRRQADMERMYASSTAQGGVVGVETAHGYSSDADIYNPPGADAEGQRDVDGDEDAMDLG